MQCLSNLKEAMAEESMNAILSETSFMKIAELLGEYLQNLRNGNGTLSTFWMSYVDIVETLLNMIRASREGDWQLHLASIRAKIPGCFTYDRLNYARYLPAYYAEMKSLETHNQDIHNYLTAGGFTVQLGADNPFGRIPVDQTIEETINKDTQTAGGTKGFSLKAGTISRYYLTAEYRSSFLRYLRQMLSLDDSGISHGDLTQPRIQKDEADVEAIMDMLETSWVNPFSTDKLDIMSLSTAATAPDKVVHDLLNAYAIGEQKYVKFKEERLEASPPTVKFHDRIPKQNLKTLSDVNKKKKTVRVSGKEVILRADKNLFGNMLIIAQGRQLNMQEVLAHPLGPIPWTLANPDGSLRKTTKSDLKRSLEKNAVPRESFEKPACCIIDGMALIQKVEGDRKAFAEIADQALGTVLREGAECQRIDVVFDVYREVTIKQAERDKRGEDTGTKFKNIAPGHRVQLWRAFLSSSDNKSSFIKFLSNQWTDSHRRQRLNEKVLYVTCEEDCHKVKRDRAMIEEELHSTQEEADTRLLLHAEHASRSGSKSVVIVSEDTDVFLLCLACQEFLSADVVLKCGDKNRVRYLDIRNLTNAIGRDMCQALLGMHAFTGCDTVSAFFGKGKAKALRILQTDSIYRDTFKQLGQEWMLSEDTFKQLEAFACVLYDNINSGKRTVNELRYKLFVAKRGEAESTQLPPCRDCLIMHAMRTNYQVGIWRRCLEPDPEIPYPIDHGWVMDAPGVLSVDWLNGPVAPDDVMEMLSCKCKRQCSSPDCVCIKNGLKCTYMCSLQTCGNIAAPDDIPEYFDEVDDLDGNVSEEDEKELE